jgi:hypothetical protein
VLIKAWVSADGVWRVEQTDNAGFRILMHRASVAERLPSRETVERRLRDLGAPSLAEMAER